MSSKRGIFIFLIFAVLATSGDAAECARGSRTSLQITSVDVPLIPRHGQSIGRTKIVLRSEPDGEEIFSKTYDGNWICLGFNSNTKTYFIGGIFERGAWLPLGSILYLREEGRSIEQSSFDRSGFLAMASLTSPDGRYIVFIGGPGSAGDLYVFDTERDTIKKLGPAPAPPPNALTENICSDSGEPFEWGTCWADRYIEMDAGILRFASNNELEVSYGKDKPAKRALKRWTRRYLLTE